MELPGPRPAAEEIHPAAFELPGTGSREDEAHAEFIHHRLDFVQEKRKLLYFIDDDRLRRTIGSQLLAHGSGARRKTGKCLGMKKVVVTGFGETVLEQPSLAGLARPEKEKGFRIAGQVKLARDLH